MVGGVFYVCFDRLMDASIVCAAVELLLHRVYLLKQPARKLLRLDVVWAQIKQVVGEFGGNLGFVLVVTQHQQDVFEYCRVFRIARRPSKLCELRLHDVLQRRREGRPKCKIDSSHGKLFCGCEGAVVARLERKGGCAQQRRGDKGAGRRAPFTSCGVKERSFPGYCDGR